MPESRPESGPDAPLERARTRLAEAREALADAERALGAAESQGSEAVPEPAAESPEPTWRERLWTAPSEARVGVQEVCQALGVSESWVYSRTRQDADPRLPHAKMSGSLVFRCGELRAWIRQHEDVQVAGPSDPPEGTVRLHREEVA